MNLSMPKELAAAYKSGSQMAGNVSETWGSTNFYCPNCSSPKLDWLKPGTKANDYRCPACGYWYQLKSQKNRIGNTITDGAYAAMMEAIKEDRSPNFFFLHYDYATWTVRNLLLVPHFAFPPSAIIKRKPLSATARRAGWVGCNFALNQIPPDARIAIIKEQEIVPAAVVRENFKRIKPLKDFSVKDRGWILDVFNIVQRLGKPEFSNADVYAFKRELEALHPDNRNIEAKIRQKLQNLRDRGFLIQPEHGTWRLTGGSDGRK